MALFDHTLDHVSPENWESLDLRVLLARSTGTAPNLGAATVAAAVSSGLVELTATGYEREALSGLAVLSDGSSRGLDANSVTWAAVAAGQSVSGALVYLHDDDDTDAVPVLWVPATSPVPTTGGAFTVAWSTSGLIVLQEPA